jgi:predicted RNA binding protein YcfA (HicA-like mRNA interferase family)
MPSGWKPKNFRALAKDLNDAGFDQVPGRGKGSHKIFKGNGRTIVVPDHGSKDIAAGTMRNIARQAGVSPEDLFGSGKAGKKLELTPEQVNEGVADARGATGAAGTRGRSGGQRGVVSPFKHREERGPRR